MSALAHTLFTSITILPYVCIVVTADIFHVQFVRLHGFLLTTAIKMVSFTSKQYATANGTWSGI